jgi:hypothetical protein
VSDNVLQTIQKLLQDVIAPDLRELRVRVEDLQKQVDTRFADAQRHTDLRFADMQMQMNVRLAGIETQLEVRVGGIEQRMVYLEKSLLSAFAESQARIEITGSKAVVDLRERVAVLESKHA